MAPVAATDIVQRSFDDLGTPLVDTTFCVLDLETTGSDRVGDTITEIGVVKVRGGECLGTFQTLVNPGRAIPPRISVLTGLTDAIVATAPRIEQVLGPLMRFLDGAVLVGHNVRFDLAFLRAALERDQRPPYQPTVVDTVSLARRLVRDEVPDCRLGTLASRFRLDHRPTHRALDDALATVDLLHLLIERATGLGVTGLDDLVGLARLGAHPQAAKLRLTTDLPRSPGVYLFRGHRGEVLYVGKATNLRQRVRSYFGSDDRRKVSPMLRETSGVDHLPLPDPITAEVVEQRLIARLLPRYNRAGTRADRYCYIRLDTDAPWPRLAVVREPSPTGVHLGPIGSRATARLIVEAIESVVPLRRCSTRLGRSHRPDPTRTPCGSAQLGVAACPCATEVDPARYAAAVATAAAVLQGDSGPVVGPLLARMSTLAAAERFEEAALARDRLQAVLLAVRRHHLVDALRRAGRCTVELGDSRLSLDDGRLIGVVVPGRLLDELPIDTPPAAPPGRPLDRHLVDEALCLARHLDRHHQRVRIVSCEGEWRFPVTASDQLPRLDAALPGAHAGVVDGEHAGVPVGGEPGHHGVGGDGVAQERDGRAAA
jgi:DNA polymerase-3 subunit epsilon